METGSGRKLRRRSARASATTCDCRSLRVDEVLQGKPVVVAADDALLRIGGLTEHELHVLSVLRGDGERERQPLAAFRHLQLAGRNELLVVVDFQGADAVR